jgi:phage shock protein C
MTSYAGKNKYYRSRDGIIFGICQGIADWRDLPVFYIRLTFFILLIVTGFFPALLIYLIAGIILPLEPEQGRGSFRDDDFDRERTRENTGKQYNEDKEKDWDQRFYDR